MYLSGACVSVYQLQDQLSKMEADFEAQALDSEFQLNEMNSKIENLTEERLKLEAALSEQKA